MNPLIIFTHIPKTAGSSFRNEAEHCFGSDKTVYDYQPMSMLTSSLVREWVFDRQDMEGFAKAVERGGCRFLTGHFPRAKYAEVFPDAAFVSWVREPVAQVWSLYRHFCRHHDYDRDLETFCTDPRFRNLQTRRVGPNPETMAFIGITEAYGQSLQRFNDIFSLNFRERRANTSPDSDLAACELPRDVQDRIRSLNAKDMALYEQVKQSYRCSVST